MKATDQGSVAPSERAAAQAQKRLAVGLAMIAGYVDAHGFLSYSTYLSLMSGNTTQAGLDTGQGNVVAAGLNTTLSHVGAQSVSLTYVTGALDKIGSHLALAVKRAPLQDAQGPWDTQSRRACLLAGLWTAFLLGALVAAAVTPFFAGWVLLPPFLIMLLLTSPARWRTRP